MVIGYPSEGMEQTLSPEAVEALARSLAAKMETQKGGLGNLTDQMMIFQQEDKAFKEQDAAFKKEVTEALRALRTVRNDVPIISISMSIVAIVLATISIVGMARNAMRLDDEIRARFPIDAGQTAR